MITLLTSLHAQKGGEPVNNKFMRAMQRFGGAMFTMVLYFTYSGMIVALSLVFSNPVLFWPSRRTRHLLV